MTKKQFDCVEMQHEGGRHIYEALKGKTRDEQIAYWRGRSAELRQIKDKKDASPILTRS